MSNSKEESQWQKTDWRLLLFVSAASLAIVSLHIIRLPIDVYWWTPDSSYYIEAARSFIREREFLVSPWWLSEYEVTPLLTWPPGYPVLIAMFSVAGGVSVEQASYLIPLISWFLLAPAVLYAISPLIDDKQAAWIAILACSSPGILNWGWRGLSDLPFLVISVLSIAFLVRSLNGKRALIYAFAAGLFAGLAYTIRNVGLALMGTLIAVYALSFVLGLAQRKDVVARLIFSSIGIIVCVLPLIGYNVRVSGSIQPYDMAPSTVSLSTNLRVFLEAAILDMSGISASLTSAAWAAFALLFTAGLIVLVRAGVRRKRITGISNQITADWTTSQRFALMSLLLYVLFGSILVIAAKTVYQLGEMINPRYTMQYSWATLAILFSVLRCQNQQKWKNIPVIALTGCLIVGHMNWGWTNYWSPEAPTYHIELSTKIYGNESVAQRVRALPEATIMLSNMADVLRIKTGRIVRQLYPQEIDGVAEKLAELESSNLENKDLTIILFAYPEGVIFTETHARDFSDLGFSVELEGQDLMILTRITGEKY